MESRRGRRHRAALVREDGLVAFAIQRGVRTLDVRWQRDMADAIERRVEVAFTRESQSSFAILAPREDCRFQIAVELDAFTSAQLAAGVNESRPGLGIVGDWAKEQDFEMAGHAETVAVEPGRED